MTAVAFGCKSVTGSFFLFLVSLFLSWQAFAPPAQVSQLQVHAMRLVVQKVRSASVRVGGNCVSEIGPGLVALVGLHEHDG